MTCVNTMKHLFELCIKYLKTDEEKDKNTLKYEIELLHQTFTKNFEVSNKVIEIFAEVLIERKGLYEEVGLIERHKAEERVRELLEVFKVSRVLTEPVV